MRLVAAFLLTAAVALGACGGDSNDNSASSTTGTDTTTGATGEKTATTGTKSKARKDKRKHRRSSRRSSRAQRRYKARVRRNAPDRAARSDQRNLREIQRRQRNAKKKGGRSGLNVSKLPPAQRDIYATSAAACQLQGPQTIKNRYKISGSDPRDIASGLRQERPRQDPHTRPPTRAAWTAWPRATRRRSLESAWTL